MSVALLAPAELPELEEFFRAIDLHMPEANFQQFAAPRRLAPNLELGTFVLRDAGRIVGSVGWIEVPVRVNDAEGRPLAPDRLRAGRWVMNFFLEPQLRGRGVARALLDALHAACPMRFVIGSTAAAQRAFDKFGYRDIGRLSMVRWARPCLDPRRLVDRLRRAERQPPPASITMHLAGDEVTARRVPQVGESLPWTRPEEAGMAHEAGAPRDAAYLTYAYGGHLARYHALYVVTVNGEPAGLFVVVARTTYLPKIPLPLLGAEIIDLDARPGSERAVILAARKTAFASADVVRLRICGDRFTRVLRELNGGRELIDDIPLRLSIDAAVLPDGPYRERAGVWRLTYGDDDQFRVRATSQAWITRGRGD
jgi:GNAT superfamily N-acetyltransferase